MYKRTLGNTINHSAASLREKYSSTQRHREPDTILLPPRAPRHPAGGRAHLQQASSTLQDASQKGPDTPALWCEVGRTQEGICEAFPQAAHRLVSLTQRLV